jgi:hypothetical protein
MSRLSRSPVEFVRDELNRCEPAQGIDMDHVAVKKLRIGAVVLLAAVVACGVCCESAAQTVEHSASQPRVTRTRESSTTPVVASGQTSLGAMRYYGGPKSPMWRGPASN